jgi:predicted nucleotidyltransferase
MDCTRIFSHNRSKTNPVIATPQIDFDRNELAIFCRKWRICELALFGSVLRDDFRPDSDVDVVVAFEPDAPWNLWDRMDMQDELEQLFGRPVDLVSKRALKNPFRRHEILSTRQVIYAA